MPEVYALHLSMLIGITFWHFFVYVVSFSFVHFLSDLFAFSIVDVLDEYFHFWEKIFLFFEISLLTALLYVTVFIILYYRKHYSTVAHPDYRLN